MPLFRKKNEISPTITPIVVGTFHRSHRSLPLRSLMRWSLLIVVIGALMYWGGPPLIRYARYQYLTLRGIPDNGVVVTARVGSASGGAAASVTPSTPGGASGSNATPSQATACGVAGMPQEVCDIAKSVEANGVKNNPSVVGMTDSIPDSATFKLNYGSWKFEDEKTGYMSGTGTAYGFTKPGTLTFRHFSGSWKVTDIELDN
jgi:hypothetical protein